MKLKLNSQIQTPVKWHHYSVIGYFDQLSINRKSLYILSTYGLILCPLGVWPTLCNHVWCILVACNGIGSICLWTKS